MADYQDTRWPWRLTITYTDGTTRTASAGGRPVTEFAEHVSKAPGVARVDLVTAFAAGEQISPDTV